ncbi:translocon-associated protein subunit delta [Strongylocentrotus purpuratus]|uniref:Translocon-associated protein subunit delta n=1 Tax=Strongylocentrotus purpuratus TaxID=7668 RepID=A0A7M7ST27_STRPU|nr:translocon-associated protein subunit delta [Strongylocentrotus purpuratus]|eukprot:XP_782059.2 PREDICTED: translocon-associated protein subunit delta [Strongylocentrotus purpuratus]
MASILQATFVCVFLAVFAPHFSLAESCIGASFNSKTYTTTDGALSTETVFLVEFQLSCKNKISNIFLNAEVDGKQIPVSRSGDNKYQVSWTAEHKKAPSGTYSVCIYDEEGFSALRKALRTGEESKVKPLITVPVDHPGVSKGPWVSTEIIATGIAGLVWYAAFATKKSIQS